MTPFRLACNTKTLYYRGISPVVRLTCFILFVSLVASAQADSPIVFNEIMYHPATNEPLFEWVELQNQMSVDIDMSRWSLDGGVHFTFPSGTIIPGGGYLVVAGSTAALSAATGVTNVIGPFTNRLSNAGDKLQVP